jgi:hypothetical protein
MRRAYAAATRREPWGRCMSRERFTSLHYGQEEERLLNLPV